MEVVDYRITEGSNYLWECYGPNAYCLDAWNGDQDGHSHSIIFDTKTQEVYEVTSYDYRSNRAYRLINQSFVELHNAEARRHQVDHREAWDDVNFVDLEVDDDWIQKAMAIELEELDYDDRVQVPLTLDDDHMFELMKLAHEQDITLNQLVENILREAIANADTTIDIPKPKKKKKGK